MRDIFRKAPSRYVNRLRRLGPVPFLLLSILALLFAMRVEFATTLDLGRTGSEEELSLEAYEQLFSPLDYVAISVEVEELYSRESMEILRAVSESIRLSPTVRNVVSAATISAPIEGSGAQIERLLDENLSAESIGRLKIFLGHNELYRTLLSGRSSTSWIVLAFPDSCCDTAEFAEEVLQVAELFDISGEQVFGQPVLFYYLSIWIWRDFARLLLAGVVIIFLVEVLALSTSYGIHLFRLYSLRDDMTRDERVDSAAEIITLAGGTTLIGFATLLLSSLAGLRYLGGFMIAGIALSIVTSLFLLPSLFSLLPAGAFQAKRARFGRRIPRTAIAIAPLILLGVGALGMSRLHHDPRFTRAFHPRSEVSRTYDYFTSEHYGIDQIEVIVDTRSEFGLIDLENYEMIKRAIVALAQISTVDRVVSMDQIVEWTLRGASGSQQRISPSTSAELGETLELLSYQDGGFSIQSLVDVEFRATKFMVQLQIDSINSRSYAESFTETVGRIESVLGNELREMDWKLSGALIRDRRLYGDLVRSQIQGVTVVFLVLVVLLVIAFRSIRFAGLALLPCIGAGLIYFGFYGWAGYPMGISASVSFALIMGVSVDDVIFLLLYYRRLRILHTAKEAVERAIREAGVPIIETTLIIVLGLSVFLASFSAALFHAGIATILGLAGATAITILTVPRFVAFVERRRQE